MFEPQTSIDVVNDGSDVVHTRLPMGAELQAALNLVPAHTWYANSSGGLIFVNQRCGDYLGLTNDHPLRQGIDTGAAWDSHIPLLHPDDHEETRRVWSTCLRSGCADQVSFRVRHADGVYRWFLSRAEPVRSSDGTLLYWIGVNLDIEEWKRAELELRDVVDTIPAIVWVALPDGSNTYVNSRFVEYSGMSTAQTAGSGWRAAIHPDDLDEHDGKWRASVESGEPLESEVRFRRTDGQYRWHLNRGLPLRDEDGNIIKWYGVVTDIEDRKRVEEALRQSEHYLQEREMELHEVLDFTPQLIAVTGSNRERLYANRPALDYLGISLDEWKQRSIGSEIHPADVDRLMSQVEQAWSKGSAYEMELRVRKSDGSYRWFLARYNPVRNDQGQILRWYVACTDINDRKRAEEKLQEENVALREEIDKASMFEEIVGTSSALKAVLSRVSKVAPSDSTVLITGETGTGKELIARAIHKRSNRSLRAFVSVNCAALAPSLITSELFGYEKGAFTGATQRRLGRFEVADGGTIFLDEVGELSADIQVALLRVLQEHEFERVGGGQRIRVDVRVIAATNRNLEAAVASGTFRQDLFYRLNVFPIEMPPLRQRKDDILMLLEYFVQRYGRRAGKDFRSIDKRTLEVLQCYDWPGNIRELQNIIERSVILSSSEVFSVDGAWLSKETFRPTSLPEAGASLQSEIESRSEREIIETALAETRGRVAGSSGAAAKLGISPSTLDRRIKALKINKKQFKYLSNS